MEDGGLHMLKKILPVLIALLSCAASVVLAEIPMGEGHFINDNKLNIRLWEGADTGRMWSFDMGDNEQIALASEQTEAQDPGALDGAPRMHHWVFAPMADGEGLITFSYGDPDQPNESERTMCYTVAVDGGRISLVEAEDLSEGVDNAGDDDAVVPYDGVTGGVALNVPEGMVETETDEGALLTSEDATRTILIDYQRDDNVEELFGQLKDAESAAAVYEDADSGAKVISSSVDFDGDPPSATLVLSSPEGYTVYTGYQAPEGGVLHVHTTYAFGDGVE